MVNLYIFCILVIIGGIVLSLLGIIVKNKKINKFKKNKKDKYAILIPARDESKVIDNLLKSIEVQNKNMSNVYVIVEEDSDPTCDICKKYGTNVFVRPKPIKARKGYALDECIKEILKKEHYDLYFLFDADNVLDKNFIKNMLKVWRQGYEIAIGYRNILNPKNLVSCSSGLMFIFFNNLINKNIRMRIKQPVMLSGTGLYISGNLIEKWGGFPFYTLTEDYELSMYMYEHNIVSAYVEEAIYFDEQPINFSTSIKQRSRWIKGFLEKRKGILKNEKYSFFTKLGVLPIISMIAGLVFLFFLCLGEFIYYLINGLAIKPYQIILLCIPLLAYLVLWLPTYYVMLNEKDKINIPKKLKIPCLFFTPLFLMSFVISFARAIFKKDFKWEKVDHVGK